jgi:hypothetical protein
MNVAFPKFKNRTVQKDGAELKLGPKADVWVMRRCGRKTTFGLALLVVRLHFRITGIADQQLPLLRNSYNILTIVRANRYTDRQDRKDVQHTQCRNMNRILVGEI